MLTTISVICKYVQAELTNNALELKVLCEREAIYRLLHQTTPQNTVQNFSDYTIGKPTLCLKTRPRY